MGLFSVLGFAVVIVLLVVVAIWAGVLSGSTISNFFSDIAKGKLPSVFGLSPVGFLLVIVAGALAFSAYVLYSLHWGWARRFAKVLLVLVPITLFFGALFIELMFFQSYFPKTTSISVQECQQTSSITGLEELPRFTTCVFTGYYPSQGVNYASIGFITFVIFIWVLPFAFLFAFFYGLFYSTMGPMFGGGNLGRTVSIIITFIVAMYGARQMIGSFLIDFLAYGSWGLVGIFIPLLLAVGIKRILESIIPIGVETQTMWDTVGTNTYAELRRYEQQVRDLRDAAAQATQMQNVAAQQGIHQTADGIARGLDIAIAGATDAQVRASLQAIRDQLRHQFHV